jgi:hypothetical protein
MTKKIVTDLTWDELLGQAADLEFPEGKTISELCEQYNVCQSATRKMVKRLIADGKLEKGWKRINRDGSGPTKAASYRIVKE